MHGHIFLLQFLESEFLAYLDSWEESVNGREGYEHSDRKRMLLSSETLLGLRITSESWCKHITIVMILFHISIIAYSFVKLVKYIFTIPGVKAFLSQKICQDPVEKFFGCQRQRGGTNENPTVAEFCKNTQALRVIGNFCRPSVRGNCRGSKSHLPICEEENEPLPKRRRLAKK